MKTNVGRTMDNMVPRKLAKGMAVVVWIKESELLFWGEIQIGIKHNTWLRAELVNECSTHTTVVLKGRIFTLVKGHAIVVRSTSYTDNEKKYATIKNKQVYAARMDTKEFKSF